MSELSWGFHVRPFPGERVSGDAVAVRELADGVLLAMIDGLGHGPEAHRAARVAVDHVERARHRDLGALMTGLHGALATTRGAAIGLCFVEYEAGTLEYCGIGNIAIRSVGRPALGLFSRDGIVGHIAPQPQVQQIALYRPESRGWRGEASDARARRDGCEVIVVHTDGIPRSAEVAVSAGLARVGTSELARRIVRDHGRANDDAGCIVLRYVP